MNCENNGYLEFWPINWHEGVNVYNFLTETSIVHLQHKGSMIQVQCQLVIHRGSFGLPKGTFWQFLQLTWIEKLQKFLMGCCESYAWDGRSKSYEWSIWTCSISVKSQNEKMFTWDCWGKFLGIHGLTTCSIKQFELLFSKMVKLDENECPDPEMNDFEWFDEVFNISMINMFLWFCH